MSDKSKSMKQQGQIAVADSNTSPSKTKKRKKPINALGAAGFALSAMAKAISTLYQVAGEINEWMDTHIQEMQASENLTISRTGRILEAAKTGFGLGYVASVTVIAVGQLLLGNTLAAAGTVASAAVLANPMAMTCAAVGAIIYGWGALSVEEQKDVLDRVSAGLEVGIELIKSVVNFVISTSKEVMNSKNVAELKEFIRNAASNFGRTLGDITRKVKDKMADTTRRMKNIPGDIKDALDRNRNGELDIDDVVGFGKTLAGRKSSAPKTNE